MGSVARLLLFKRARKWRVLGCGYLQNTTSQMINTRRKNHTTLAIHAQARLCGPCLWTEALSKCSHKEVLICSRLSDTEELGRGPNGVSERSLFPEHLCADMFLERFR